MKNIVKHISTILLVLVGMTTTAQVADIVTIENETITPSSDPGLLSVVAGQSVTIKPNTWIQSGTTFSATISPDAYLPHILNSNENYVFTRSFQAPITEAMLLDPAIGIKNNSDVIESVTYFDGLGRAKQLVGIKASPGKKDIVTHIEYDDYGRQARQYLPFERQNGALGSYNTVNVHSNINSYYQNKYAGDFTGMAVADVNAYSESIFEPSPLNRVLEQGAPGKDWKANPTSDTDHTIKFDWTTNRADEVVYFKVNFHENNTEVPILVKDGFYDPNELYVSITKDENWQSGQTHLDDHTTREYKDKLGRVVLKRTFNEGVSHDTYYVYDDYGNLTYVLPPKVTLSATDGVSSEELTELCYQYKYDYRNRLVEKKIPGKGWEYIIYNKLDQPVMTQDANQRTDNEWLFTKYDALGRIAYTGIVVDGRDKNVIQTELTNMTGNLWVQRGAEVTIGGTTMYYTNGGYPNAQNAEVVTINYYDDYNFDTAGLTAPAGYGENIDSRTKSLATGSKVKVLGTSDWITTVTYYDVKARPIYAASKNNYLNTIDIVESKLDFAGKVLETKTTHTKGSNAPIVTIDTFVYDHMGRLLDQKQTINNQAAEQIVSNTYDELGQLESKKLGGGLQNVDYTYNVRGWLQQINDPANLGNDLFAFGINYNTISENLGATALYNGNISETLWKTANDNTKRAYGYQYDALNRITSGLSNENKYNLSYVTYDKMGNIQTLKRHGWKNSSNYWDMDILSYDYDNGNKLLKVTDGGDKNYGFKDGTNTSNDFEYDANGNMITDHNKGISSIAYNHLNLPKTVAISNSEGTGNISYIYDATGAKLKKIVTEGGSLIETEYAGNYIYKNGQLEFFNHPEGYLEPNGTGSYDYVYQYKDHLGNIRLSYSDRDNNGTINALTEIVEEKNYYPFGLQHKGYNNTITGRKHNYGYNGKEEQNELGLEWLDFQARNYDPAIGRWMNLDPLAEEMTRHSPYNYGFDNPIYYTDPDGMMPIGRDGELEEETNQPIRPESNVHAGFYVDNYTGKIVQYEGFNGTLPGFTFLGEDDATSGEIADAYAKWERTKSFIEKARMSITILDALEAGRGQSARNATKRVFLKNSEKLLRQFKTRVYKALKNIPAGWKVKSAKKGDGIIVYNPQNPQQNVRIMKGDPSSPHASQKVPYVKDQSQTPGQLIDINRNPIPGGNTKAAEAHIPLTEWKGF